MWQVTFNNAGNPQNMMLAQFLIFMLTVDEEATLRVFKKSTISNAGNGVTIHGPTGTMDVLIERK